MRSSTRSRQTRPLVIVDTNVVSYLFKRDTRAAAYEPHLINQVPVISFVTVAETQVWAELRNWGSERRARLDRFLATYTVHFPDLRLCRLWASAIVAARRAGRPIGQSDAWIAATALLYNVPLVTHNPKDYVGVPGLTLISEAPR